MDNILVCKKKHMNCCIFLKAENLSFVLMNNILVYEKKAHELLDILNR